MEWKHKAEKWLGFAGLDAELKQELEGLRSDEKMLEDAFYKDLEFGTGGMRGEIGAGTNRMNAYTVRKAAAGLASFISSQGEEAKRRGVVIAYDSRHKSPEFAMEAARTLAAQNIYTYVFESLRPTPVLSFAVRHLQAYGGIVITASHNPPEYNGFKVYGPDGGQLPPESADAVIDMVNSVGSELDIKVGTEEEYLESGLIQMIGAEVDRAYQEKLMTILESPNLGGETDIQVVFTPLHGTANLPVRHALASMGYKHVHVVEEQEKPDPNFSTVKSPNPEEHAAFELAIRDGKRLGADILIATDPDADRLGIAVKNEQGEYVVLTGNQTGALLLDYILERKKEKGTLPANGVVMKTIVTSELGRSVAQSYGMETVDVLTGFKFIAEKIKEYEQSGDYKFLFGYEESYGYLIGDFARDKDAVQAAILAVEVCAYYKNKGMSLYDALLAVYEKYGYYREGLRSLTLKGKEGAEWIQRTLNVFRESQITSVGNIPVTAVEDYKSGVRTYPDGTTEAIGLPNSNVIKYHLEDGSWMCLRPSGTEPKIKFYFSVNDTSLQASEDKLKRLEEHFMELVHQKMEECRQ